MLVVGCLTCILCSSSSVAATFESYSEGGRTFIFVKGPIIEGDASAFFRMSREVPNAVILLESEGGSVAEGLSIAADIALRGFATVVGEGEGCHSICAVMWISGSQRYMSQLADISVHAAYQIGAEQDGGHNIRESGVANARIGAYLNELGLNTQVVEYFTIARPDEPLLPITPFVAQLLDIDVYVDNGERVIAPSERPSPHRITRQVVGYVGLANHCSELFDVGEVFWTNEARRLLSRGHNLFGEEVFVNLLGGYMDASNADRETESLVRWCLAAEQRLRANSLSTGLVGPSFDCGKAESVTELTLCGSPELWPYDRVLSRVYVQLRNASTGVVRQDLITAQRSWLSRRDECGSSVDCLRERYSSRLFDFGL
ncbi:hypothetical protein [Halocynthiibacter styelae]|uniref:Lysozyme inhibitor LprI N-terminal domain-containing protein n=1 Tax=Halocynthiibacter styelae TaxID=2761955 RepID=A0A8J7LWU1_9RHOB|nr:hypothetical protein [Paenihalocynthiibacter styelae]MBI1494797.1 hypothetical protein [Paenihalocynthiibacter styelae]